MGDDDLVLKLEKAAEEKAAGLLKRWGVPPKAIAAILTILVAVLGGVGAKLATGQGPRDEYEATRDEVRDAERIRASSNQIETQYKSAKEQVRTQANALLARAQSRIGRSGLSYDMDKSVWYADVAQVSSGVAAVTSK